MDMRYKIGVFGCILWILIFVIYGFIVVVSDIIICNIQTLSNKESGVEGIGQSGATTPKTTP
jgi:hypothetical protein